MSTSATPEIRARGWCFTINNPQEPDDQDIEHLVRKAQYVCYGKELGEENTPHYQGYIYFTNPRKFPQVKAILRRAHIEKQKGNCYQAITYCQKDGDFKEWGQKPENPDQKLKWRSIIEAAENGNLASVRSDHPRIYLTYLEKLKSLRKPSSLILETINHEWWYGETGTGKSMKLWNDHPLHYQKQLNKWWDGYENQDVVAIEEWSPKNEVTASQLKVWADRYPFPGQIKNGTLHGIRPLKIIVTSNYTIDQCFPNTEDSLPLKRRFKVVRFDAIFVPRAPIITSEDIDALLSLSETETKTDE